MFPEFWMLDSDDELTYSTLPSTGARIALNRLQRRMPDFWVSGSLHRKLQPKTLVITDVFLEVRYEAERQKLKIKLGELHNQGFTILIWQDGKAVPFTLELLDLVSFDKNLISTPTSFLTDSVAQEYQLSKSAIHLLDDYWITRLLDDQAEPSEYRLYASLMGSVYFTEQELKIIGDKATCFIHDVYPKVKNSIILGLPIIERYKYLTISYDNKQIPVDSLAHEVDVFLRGGSPELLLPMAAKIRSLSDWHGIDSDIIKQLLLEAENIKVLNLKHTKLQNVAPLNLIPPRLNSLEHLSFAHNTIALGNLSQFLQAAANLKQLDLSRSTIKIDLSANPVVAELSTLQDPAIDLSNLQVLNLSSSNISVELLLVLLGKASKLHVLNLSHCKWDTELLLENNSLSSLQSLNLNGAELSATSFVKLLLAAPNLQQLKMYSFQLDGELSSLPPGCLQQLKSLDLTHSKITASQLAQLLLAAPNLQTIKMKYNPDLGDGALALDENSLSNLQSLDLEGSALTGSQLERLIHAAPNLQSLNLHRFEFKEGPFFVLRAGCLAQLQSLQLIQSNVTAIHLTHLLSAAVNLESMFLTECKHLGDGSIALPEGCLTKMRDLTMIRIVSTPITIGQLEKLLWASPQLTSLELANVDLENSPLILPENHLPFMNSLVLRGNSISSSQLAQLFRACPKLQTIAIDGCEFLNNENLPSLLKYMPHIQKLSLGKSSITMDDVNLLLSNAPYLKDLSLRLNQYLGNHPLSLKRGSLPQLTRVDLSLNKITAAQLDNLLNAAPNLTQLIMDGVYLNAKELSPENQERLKRLNVTLKANPYIPDQSSSAPDPVEPTFDARDYLTYEEPKEEFKYPERFSGFQQGMIIAKFSHYLLDKDEQQYSELVQSMQGGICNALARLFCHEKNFDDFFRRIKAWNPKTGNPSQELINDFGLLLEYVKRYQGHGKESNVYLGEHWLAAIQRIREPFVLINAWHAIGIKPPGPGSDVWTVYDSDALQGPRQVPFAELKTVVSQALGKNISLVAPAKPGPFNLQCPTQFLSNGGLIALGKAANLSEVVAQLKNQTFSSDELADGLFIRNLKGKPAWFLGMHHQEQSVRQLTDRLLQDYQKQNCNGDKAELERRLKQSLSYLTPEELQGTDKAIREDTTPPVPDTHTETTSPLTQAIAALKAEHALTHWCQSYLGQKASASSPSSLVEYSQRVFHLSDNTLIGCSSADEVRRLQLYLFQQGRHSGRPVYLINSPDELYCGSYIDEHGVMREGPGGPLYAFLRANKNNNPTLLINYDNFKDDDFVRYNGLLDKQARIGSFFFHELFADEPAPHALSQEKTQLRVIGLQNQANPNAYTESDFTSRMKHHRKALKDIPPLPVKDEVKDKTKQAINLFQSPFWQTELLGQWVPQGKHFVYQEGLLQKALRESSFNHLELLNGLSDNEEFKAFWQQALFLGYIMHQNRRIDLPPDLSISYGHGYAWESLTKELTLTRYLSGMGPGEVINPARFERLFSCYQLSDGNLCQSDGLLDEAAKRPDKTLALCISRDLDEHQWAKLLSQAQQAEVKLNLSFCAHVTLPQPLLTCTVESTQVLARAVADKLYDEMDDAMAQAKIEELKPNVCIDISEVPAADLLTRMQCTDLNAFTFKEEKGALIKALEEKQTVVLTGQIKPETMDELQALLQQRSIDGNASGQVHIIPSTFKAQDDLSAFHTLANTPAADVDAQTFTASRIAACEQALHDKPFVVLLGLSGVGKTSFVEKELCGEGRHRVHHSLASWLAAKGDADHDEILFVDEANLKHSDFTQFRGLLGTPPTVHDEGQVHKLSPRHKVVFAANPLSYGEGRRLPSLFAQHGQALVFGPLPHSVIKARVLRPVFSGSSLASADVEQIMATILEVYTVLCRYSTTEILISPRELQMMALLTQQHCQIHDTDPKATAAYFAYELASPLVPQAHLARFMADFKPKSDLAQPTLAKKVDGASFHITKSRQPIALRIQQMLDLRKTRQQHTGLNEAQLYGGLGGIVLQGLPGVGKSDMLLHLLCANGLKEGRLDKLETESDGTYFYRIPADAPLEDKKHWLSLAFEQGAIVLMDEFNSSPMLEQHFNHWLMGKNAEGKPPQKPGFLFLGTGNPPTFAGRKKTSEAANRRVHTMRVPEYSLAELIDVLQARQIPLIVATIMSQQWLNTYQHAKAHQLTPPTFRTLRDMADDWVKGQPHVAGLADQAASAETRESAPEPLDAGIDDVEANGARVGEQEEQQRTHYHLLRLALGVFTACTGVTAIVVGALALAGIIVLANPLAGALVAGGGIAVAVGLGISFFSRQATNGQKPENGDDMEISPS